MQAADVCTAWRDALSERERAQPPDLRRQTSDVAAQTHMECTRWALHEPVGFGHVCVPSLSMNESAFAREEEREADLVGNTPAPARKRPRDFDCDATTGEREQMEGVRDFTPAPLVGSCA